MGKLLAVAAVGAAIVAVAGVTPALASDAVTITFASGRDWVVFSSDPGRASNARGRTFLGSAELVCLNQVSPYVCPAGAVDYGYPFGGGWPADLSAVPGAMWIWAPGVTGTTAPAPLASYYFSKTFVLTGYPTGGTISVAADDFAAVSVNGTAVGSIGSTADAGAASDTENTLHTFDVAPFLKPGENTITVKAQNGSPFFSPICNDGCPYDENPAGVVFGGSLSFVRGV
jgi:hypothetical protein